MKEKKTASTPEILNIAGTIQDEELAVRIRHEKDKLPHKDAPVYNRASLIQVKNMNKEKVKDSQILLFDNDEYTQSIDITERPNGEYLLKVYSYQKDENEKEIPLGEGEASFIIMHRGSRIINPLTTIEFDNYVNRFIAMTPGMKKYVDDLILKRTDGVILRGLFVEYEVKGAGDGIYHKALLSLERNGELINGKYPIIFSEVEAPITEEGVCFLAEKDALASLEQKGGDKTGIAFIPVEIRDEDNIRLKLTLSEYEDPGFRDIIDENESYILLSNLSNYAYVDFGLEKPQIIFSEGSKNRPAAETIRVLFNNVNFAKYTATVKIERDGEEDLFHMTTSPEAEFNVREPGRWKAIATVYDCNADLPREELEKCPEILKEEKEYMVYEPCSINIKHDKVLKKGSELEILILSSLPAKAKRGYVRILSYEEPLSLKLSEVSGEKDMHTYRSDISFQTKELPSGLHVILVTYLLDDKSEVSRSSTFLITENESFDMDYFN